MSAARTQAFLPPPASAEAVAPAMAPGAAEAAPHPLRRFDIDWSGPIPPMSDVEMTPAELEAAWAAQNPDLGLIRDCARVLFLDQRVNAFGRPPHPEPRKEKRERKEFDRLTDTLCVAEPVTLAGAAALARVALLSSFAIDQSPWDGTAGHIAHRAILLLAGPTAAEEEAQMRAENEARLAAWRAGKSA